MNATRIHRRRLPARGSERGAAMVEGIVVMTTMLVFLGMNVWVAKAYGGKLDQASSTRRDALYYASNSCESKNNHDPDTYMVSELAGISSDGIESGSADTGAELPGEAQSSADALESHGRPEGEAVKRKLNTVTAGKGGSTVSGTAIVDLSKIGLGTTVATKSWATCNEKAYNNPWTALFDFGWDFLRSAAGAG